MSKLSYWKNKAHKQIDWYWKYGPYKRRHVYLSLYNNFGIRHIADCDIEMCKKIVKFYSNK